MVLSGSNPGTSKLHGNMAQIPILLTLLHQNIILNSYPCALGNQMKEEERTQMKFFGQMKEEERTQARFLMS